MPQKECFMDWNKSPVLPISYIVSDSKIAMASMKENPAKSSMKESFYGNKKERNFNFTEN